MTYSAIATSTPTNLTTIDTPAGAEVMAVDSMRSDMAEGLLAECYSRHGLAHLAHEMHDRWGIDRQSTFTGFMTVFDAVSAEYSHPRIHTMSEVFCAALDRFITSYGHRATPDELIDLHDQFWLVALRWVEPAARPELRELWFDIEPTDL